VALFVRENLAFNKAVRRAFADEVRDRTLEITPPAEAIPLRP